MLWYFRAAAPCLGYHIGILIGWQFVHEHKVENTLWHRLGTTRNLWQLFAQFRNTMPAETNSFLRVQCRCIVKQPYHATHTAHYLANIVTSKVKFRMILS